MTQEFSLTEGKISTTLLRFALPFLLASFLQALYGAADLYVVGRFGTAAGVSAVAIGSQVMQTITGIILGISTGGTVLLGRCIGEANPRGAAKAVGTIASSFLLLAVILTPLMRIYCDCHGNASGSGRGSQSVYFYLFRRDSLHHWL